MIAKRIPVAAAVLVFVGSTLLAVAQERKETAGAPGANAQANAQQVAVTTTEPKTAATSAAHSAVGTRDAAHSSILEAGAIRIEGEKRFRTNCGRCHVEPHKFPPRAMATVVRHMRVRAMLTEEDMKFILNYMTE
jgi:mono/diheme cytochrome c family protein